MAARQEMEGDSMTADVIEGVVIVGQGQGDALVNQAAEGLVLEIVQAMCDVVDGHTKIAQGMAQLRDERHCGKPAAKYGVCHCAGDIAFIGNIQEPPVCGSAFSGALGATADEGQHADTWTAGGYMPKGEAATIRPRRSTSRELATQLRNSTTY